jgi:hypothetical protein
MNIMKKENCIIISADFVLNILFKDISLIGPWLIMKQEYPLLNTKAVTLIISFPAVHMCKKGFPNMLQEVLCSVFCSTEIKHNFLKNKFGNLVSYS